ncbi:MAG: hypothetical protein WD670_07580 [Actinomycetota bacterium]
MSRDINDLLQRTADAPTRALDTAAVTARARRQTRLSRGGVGLGAVAVVALTTLVASPLLDGDDPGILIADAPAPDGVSSEGFTLGDGYVWRSEPGSADAAGLAFAAEVLGWEDATVIERLGGPDDEPAGTVMVVVENAADRTVELVLEPADSTPVWEVIQVAAGVEPPISVTEAPSLVWRPSETTNDRARPFEGVTGLAYLRTPERGTVAIDIDATAVEQAQISLEGHIDIDEPFCHDIQSVLVLFHDDAGEVASAVGGRWQGGDVATCAVTPPEDQAPPSPERAPVAGTEASHWPVELIYRQPRADGSPGVPRRLRFQGTSWAAWTIQSNMTDDGPLPTGQWTDPSGPGFDDSETWIEDRSRWRGYSAELHANWRSAVGLPERVVVDLDEIPGGHALITSLGLSEQEVEAYASPNIAGCTTELDRCAPSDPKAARGIAHLTTGFPLFAEERYDGGAAHTWLTAESFAYGSATGPP